MRSVVWAQFAKDRRNPIILLLFIAGSIMATLLFAGGVHSPTTVAIFSEEENAAEIEEKWAALLNTDSAFRFEIAPAERARQDVRDGRIDVALKLMETDYKLIVRTELPTILYVEQHVAKSFQREARIHALADTGDRTREEVERRLEMAPFRMEAQGLDHKQMANYDMSTQLLFAFTFLVSMMIVGLRVNNVTHDKISGVWNRMILSPMSKTGMYCGYILYSFLITMVQITVVLLIFKYGLNYEVGDQLGLVILIASFFVFSMISIAMLITGFVRTPEQFYAVYPTFIPLVPLISGAYMMPGTITNPVFTFVADLFPLAHAMEAIMSVIFYDAGLQDVLMPLLFMLLIGVVAMGVGINLIERRSQ